MKSIINVINQVIKGVVSKFISDEEYARRLGVKIGRNCYISTRHFTSESYLIEIGNYVRIAPDTKFFTHGGLWSQRKKNPSLNLEQFGKITIGDYTYIGEECLVMPGVTIGSNVIIGAATVVTKSIPDGVMVAGNPMRIIGQTDEFIDRIDKMQVIDKSIFYALKGEARRNYILSLNESKFVHKSLIKPKV